MIRKNTQLFSVVKKSATGASFLDVEELETVSSLATPRSQPHKPSMSFNACATDIAAEGNELYAFCCSIAKICRSVAASAIRPEDVAE